MFPRSVSATSEPDTAALKGSTRCDMVMITICISEAKLPNVLLVINRVFVHAYLRAQSCVLAFACSVWKDVTFIVVAVLVLCSDVFSATSCLYAKCVNRGQSSGLRSSVSRGSDVVKRPQRSGIGVRLCVSCSLQGSCLHADSLQSVCCSLYTVQESARSTCKQRMKQA